MPAEAPGYGLVIQSLLQVEMSLPRPGDATLSVARASAVLGVHPNTIRAWSDQGRLAFYRINERGDRRYRRCDLDAFMAAGGLTSADGASDGWPTVAASTSPGRDPSSSRHGAEASGRLERTLRGHRELLAITEAILGTLEPGDVLDRIAEGLAGLVAYDRLTIEVLDAESGLLAPVIARGVETDDLRARRPEDAGLAGWVLEHAEARLVRDAAPGSRTDAEPPGIGAGGPSRIVAPLRTGERAKGVLTLDRLGSRPFGPEEFELTQLFAAHASIALQNAAVHAAVAVRARSDGLTGLLNHATLMEWLARTVDARRPFSLVLLDLDDFRTVNNRFGHPAGDAFLREIARALTESVREQDIAFRYGGDEFVLALPATATDGAVAVAERMRAGLAAAGGPVTATASIGIATFPGDGATADEILLAADRASFVAKRDGRDRIVTAAEAIGPGTALVVRQPTAIDRSTLEWPEADRAPAAASGSAGADAPSWPSADLEDRPGLARVRTATLPPVHVERGRGRLDARRRVRRVRDVVDGLGLLPSFGETGH